MIEKLASLKERYFYLEGQLSDPTIMEDMPRYKKIGKEYKDLEPIVKAYDEYVTITENIKNSKL